jgi:cytochrome P450
VFAIKELHDKYGPVVRIAPNQVSFCSAASWRDIYGHVQAGQKPFLKSKFFYEAMPGESENILTVGDPSIHARMRRNLSHGFSASALSAQEGLVQGFINQLVQRLGESPNDSKDMVTWLNMLTFDIIGQLAFGESFGNLDRGMGPLRAHEVFQGADSLQANHTFGWRFSSIALKP